MRLKRPAMVRRVSPKIHATKGAWLGDFILRAKEVGVRFASPGQVYDEMVAARGAAG